MWLAILETCRMLVPFGRLSTFLKWICSAFSWFMPWLSSTVSCKRQVSPLLWPTSVYYISQLPSLPRTKYFLISVLAFRSQYFSVLLLSLSLSHFLVDVLVHQVHALSVSLLWSFSSPSYAHLSSYVFICLHIVQLCPPSSVKTTKLKQIFFETNIFWMWLVELRKWFRLK